jgi:hypothetical protein
MRGFAVCNCAGFFDQVLMLECLDGWWINYPTGWIALARDNHRRYLAIADIFLYKIRIHCALFSRRSK